MHIYIYIRIYTHIPAKQRSASGLGHRLYPTNSSALYFTLSSASDFTRPIQVLYMFIIYTCVILYKYRSKQKCRCVYRYTVIMYYPLLHVLFIMYYIIMYYPLCVQLLCYFYFTRPGPNRSAVGKRSS